MRLTFTKADRLRKRPEFLRLAHSGRRVHGRHFLLNGLPSAAGRSRLGITVTKKVGPAVTRNRIKRYCREFFRRHRHRFPGHWDINIIARRSAVELTGPQTAADLSAIVSKLPR